MSAALAIARKDWREILRSGWLGWAALALVALTSVTAVTAWQAEVSRQRTIAAADALEATNWLEQGERNPHSAAHFSRFALRPLSPLERVDNGLRDYVGAHVWMEAHLQRPAEARPAEDRAEPSLLGLLSPGWIVLHLGALVGLLLGSTAIARERDDGRLGWLRASGGDGAGLVAGKLLGTGAAALLVGLGLILSGTVGPWTDVLAGDGVYADAAQRLALWSCAALLYVGIFTALGLALSAVVPTVRSALLVALGVWTLTIIVVPRVGAAASEAWIPAPPPATFVAAMREAVHEASVRENAGHAAPATPTVTDAQGRVLSVRGIRLQQGEDIGNTVFDERYGQLQSLYDRQANLNAAFGLLSPAVALRSLSATLTGTDLAHHADFLRQAEDTRRVIIRQLNEDDMLHAGDRGGAYTADRALWEQVPRFEYRPPALGQFAATLWRDLGVLAAWAIAAVGLAFAAGTALLRRR